ncbi:MAG: GDP-mannose 4,6-dehydratase [Phycisphaerales bacterium]|nr:GDP-mannose 4,6-dehydratase [Phycisphaerales bacterium]
MKLPADTVVRLRPAYEGRNVCVTGGAGFIGGHLVDTLLALGAAITVIDDLSNSTVTHLAELIDLEPDRVRFVQGSILDDDALAEAVEGCRTVFHLAALGSVPQSVAEPQRNWSVNATGTVRVLEHARRVRAARVVFAASSSAYGDDPTVPKLESMLPRPMSPYAASKLAGEAVMLAWAKSYGLSTISLRFFNIFGPRQSADSAYAAVIAAFAKALLQGEPPVVFGDGRQSRDFTNVANAVFAMLLAGMSDKPLAGEVVNVGTGRRVNLLELAEMMAQIVAKDSSAAGDIAAPQVVFKPERAGDVKHSLADLTRARDLIGYTPLVPIEKGLEETMAWYRQSLAGTGRA